MTTRWILLPVLFYLALDFGSPWVVGAFRFNPDESVEGLQDQPSAKRRAPVTGASRIATRDVSVRQVAVARTGPDAPPQGQWIVDVRRSHRPSPDPSAPSDDH